MITFRTSLLHNLMKGTAQKNIDKHFHNLSIQNRNPQALDEVFVEADRGKVNSRTRGVELVRLIGLKLQ